MINKTFLAAADKIHNVNALRQIEFTQSGIVLHEKNRGGWSDTRKTKIAATGPQLRHLFNDIVAAGRYITIGGNLYNKRLIQAAWAEGDALHILQQGVATTLKIPHGEAEAVCRTLESERRFERIGGQIVNINAAVSMEHGGWSKLYVRFLGDVLHKVPLPLAETGATFARLTAHRNLERIGDEVVNIMMAGNVFARGPQKISMMVPGGELRLKAPDAGAVMERLAAHPWFAKIGGELVSPLVARAMWHKKAGWITRSKLRFDIAQESGYVAADEKEANRVLDIARGGFDVLQVGEYAVNAGMVSVLRLKSKSVGLYFGPSEDAAAATPEQIASLRKVLQGREDFVVVGDYAVNLKHVSHAQIRDDRVIVTIAAEDHTLRFPVGEQAAVEKAFAGFSGDVRLPPWARDAAEDVWDPEILAEIYDDVVSSQTATMAAVVAVTVAVNAG